jgi:hypothetical protein
VEWAAVKKKITIVDRPVGRRFGRRHPELFAALIETAKTGKAIQIDPRSSDFGDMHSFRNPLQIALNRDGFSFHCIKTGDGVLLLWATKKDAPR